MTDHHKFNGKICFHFSLWFPQVALLLIHSYTFQPLRDTLKSVSPNMHTVNLNSYEKTIIVSGHYLLSRFYLKHTVVRRLDSVSIFRWNLLSWVQPTELVPISGNQHPHKIEYINQAQHKPSVRVKTNIKNIKKLHTRKVQHLCAMCETESSLQNIVFFI
jgi:hypothetical protein